MEKPKMKKPIIVIAVLAVALVGLGFFGLNTKNKLDAQIQENRNLKNDYDGLSTDYNNLEVKYNEMELKYNEIETMKNDLESEKTELEKYVNPKGDPEQIASDWVLGTLTGDFDTARNLSVPSLNLSVPSLNREIEEIESRYTSLSTELGFDTAELMKVGIKVNSSVINECIGTTCFVDVTTQDAENNKTQTWTTALVIVDGEWKVLLASAKT